MSNTGNRDFGEEEAYADHTPLTWAFGDHPKVQLIAALLAERSHDVNKSDLADLAGLSRSAVYSHIDDLIDTGIVKETREVSGSQMYEINWEHDIVDLIDQIERKLLEQELAETENVKPTDEDPRVSEPESEVGPHSGPRR